MSSFESCRWVFGLMPLFCTCMTLVGCSSLGGVVSSGLEMVGVKQPASIAEAKAALPIPLTKDVALRIHAGEALNVDAESRPLSVLVRIYRLKSADAFVGAPLAAFKDADSEKAAFGADLISVREVVLTPRQKYEVVESLPLDVKFVGVVGLFRAPAQGRWRFAFERDDAAKTGVTLGAHACALSVAAGQPHATTPEFTRLTGVRCG